MNVAKTIPIVAARASGRLCAAVVLALALVVWFTAPARAYIYWTDNGTDLNSLGTTLGRANLDASGVFDPIVKSASGPGSIAVSGGYMYWLNTGTSSIGRAGLDGSGANPDFIVLPGHPSSMAVGGGYIYWVSNSQIIGRVGVDGSGETTSLFSGLPGSTNLSAIALSGSTLYVGDSETGDIDQVPAGGGTPQTMISVPATSGTAYFFSLAVGGGFIYWSIFAPSAQIGQGTLGASPTITNANYIPSIDVGTAFGLTADAQGKYLYWGDGQGTVGSIGRALNGSGSASNITPGFVPGLPGTPGGVAIDGDLDPTTTTLSCLPTNLLPGSPSTCTVTVTDDASPSTPTGTVAFSSNGTSFFSSNSCVLTALSTTSASCTVGVDASLNSSGSTPVTAAYPSDGVAHAASSANVALCVGTTAQCNPGSGGGGSGTSGGSVASGTGTSSSGGGSGTPGTTGAKAPTPAAACVVPTLARKTLAQARTLLLRAGCTLGTVTRPKVRHGHKLGALAVAAQSPTVGRQLPRGAKVALRLAQVKARKTKVKRKR